MEIIQLSANNIETIEKASIACIGFFDGFHIGHQKLIQSTILKAKEQNVLSACITFDVDPWVILHKDKNVTNLTTIEERLEMMEHLGMDRCYLLHFDQAMASLSKESFVHLLKQINVIHIFCGDDFRFGYKNEGDITYLKHTIDTSICDTELVDNQKVSSSLIEQALLEGDLTYVKQCLNYDYNVAGIVVHGRKIGHSLGFPTANIELKANYVVPKYGVYAGYIKVGESFYKTMINIGHNPTLNKRTDTSIEAHILDFNQDIYGKEVRLYFQEYIREEQKFEGRDALVNQLNNDIEFVRRMHHEVRII